MSIELWCTTNRRIIPNLNSFTEDSIVEENSCIGSWLLAFERVMGRAMDVLVYSEVPSVHRSNISIPIC